ncbi:MAG: ORF6N domain-containing protein [Akkermansiaceae bacterium]|nr:ORF6N domain-containing protein [Akkermansiaceae bacterium]
MPEKLATLVHYLRHEKVILDSDLAELYGVPTKRLNEAVKRNIERFPADLMFQLTESEETNLRSQIATSKNGASSLT